MTVLAALSPAQELARHFAERAVAWAQECAAPAETLDALREAAYRTSLAATSGNVCLRLRDVEWSDGSDAEIARTRLLDSGVVGTASDPARRPLVLDGDARLYLHRYFDYERRLARSLMARVAAPLEPVPAALCTQLDALFADNAARLGGRVDWQRVAVALAMVRRLAIISGGPGTGKTTTVVNLLACLLAQDPDCRIALAAPTGKAAARMQEAIRTRTARLPGDIAARVPTESFTVHRLLGAASGGDAFRHHAGNPLPIDVLVVDEASMLDLALAMHLFEAVPARARVIMLGDKDQLAAVEAGAVFAEISADPSLDAKTHASLASAAGIPGERLVPPPPAYPSALHGCVVWFTESYRFESESGIGRLAALVNAGEAERTVEWLRDASRSQVTWLDDSGRLPAASTIDRARRGYREYLQALHSKATTDAVFDAFARFRVLCAEREGPRGVAGMNDSLAHWFRAALDHRLDPGPRSPWYPGRPVMVMRNDYALRLYNGDTGIVLPGDDEEPMVFFPDAGIGFRAIPPARLPEHDTAFATTVHKAQGSEFDEVLLLLPTQASRVVTRELIYTAITRARRQVTLAAGAETIAAAVARRVERASGLDARLGEASAPSRG